MTITLKDLASECHVSTSTASRSIAGSYGISEKTRARVLAAANRLGYRPNGIARGLATGRSHCLGLILSDIRNPFMTELARGAEDAAYAAGYDLVLCNSDLDPEKQMRYVRSLLEKRVGGIVMNSVRTLGREQQEEIIRHGIPIVLLSRQRQGLPFSSVSADNFGGGLLAGKYLVSLGHRVIAHLTGPRRHDNLKERLRGFLKAIEFSKEEVTPVIIYGDHSSSGGYGMAKTVLGKHRDVTAIFAANDSIAFGVMRAIHEQHLRIPQDISLIGFDNVEMAGLTKPPLTTIHQPKYEMGKAAVEILLKLAGGGDRRVPEHLLFGVELVERESSEPPKRTRDESSAAPEPALTLAVHDQASDPST